MDDLDILDAHLRHLAHLGHRPNTIRARRWCLLHLRRRTGDLRTVTRDDLYLFVSRSELGADARATAITHVRGFYRWAVRSGHLTDDPADMLDRPRRLRRLPRPMSEPELRRAVDVAPEPIRAWLHLAAYAGLRCCEIAPLRGEDRHGNVLRIREQKGGDEGAVPIGPVLGLAVAHLPARGWWFPRWDGNDGPISAGQLQRHANRFLHELGIESTMHTLRHRYGSQVYEISGHDLRLTQELMRHRSILSTVGYTEIRPDRGAAVADQLL